MVERTIPNAPVIRSATVINVRAANRSAKKPPPKYARIANKPYIENAKPSSVFVIWKTSRIVGLKIRGKPNGNKKITSPATIMLNMIMNRRAGLRASVDIRQTYGFKVGQCRGIFGPKKNHVQLLVRKVINSLDPDELDMVLADLRNTLNLLDEVRADIESVEPSISFWERINVFKQSEKERDLKHFKSEQREFLGQLDEVVAELKRIISLKIQEVFAVQLKLQLGAAFVQAESLRASNSHGKAKIKGQKKLLEMLRHTDIVYSRKFGYDEGVVLEEELSEEVLRDILRRQGISL